MASIRRRYVTAAALAAAALCAGVLTASPASAAPAPGVPIPLKLTPLSEVNKPMVADGWKAPASTCGTVRAKLATYRAQGSRQVACVQETHPATPGTTGTATPAQTAICDESAQNGGDPVYNRFEECISGLPVNVNIIDVNTKQNTGTASFSVTQDILLNRASGLFVENDTIKFVSGTGDGDGPGDLTFYGTCSSKCAPVAVDTSPVLLSPGQTFSNINFTYQDTPLTTQPDTTMTSYFINFAPVGVIPGPLMSYTNPLNIRCDNELPGQSSVGCVFPDAWPDLVLSLATYGTAAVNVLAGESYIPSAPGYFPAVGLGTPLTRTDPVNRLPNYNAMCGSFTKISSVTRDSCDEYAFAATNQSGGALGLTGVNCLEGIPILYQGQAYFTPLNTVAGQACERGHVDSDLNSLVGTALSAEYSNDRIIIGDPFYAVVTP